MKPKFQQVCMTCWKNNLFPKSSPNIYLFNAKIWQHVLLQYCQGGSFNKKLLGWNDPPKSITDCQKSAEDPTDGGCHCQSQLPATNRNSTQSVKSQVRPTWYAQSSMLETLTKMSWMMLAYYVFLFSTGGGHRSQRLSWSSSSSRQVSPHSGGHCLPLSPSQ